MARSRTGISLAERAYRMLEEAIVTGEIPPGAVLSEASLATRYRIGRTPIREAMQRLSADGLVIVMPRRGMHVPELNVETQLALLEVRRPLERLAAQLAVERATPDDRARFSALGEAITKVGMANDGVGFIRLDRELNALVAASVGNEFLSRSMGLMQGLARRFWFFYYEAIADLRVCANLHAALAQAIGKANPAAAVRAADRLATFNEDFARSALGHRPRARRR